MFSLGNLWLILFLHLSVSAFPSTVHTLFNASGAQVEKYNEIVQSVKAGDWVQFSDGSRFQVTGVLGRGNTTMIFEIADGKALRVPLRGGWFSNDTRYVDFLAYYVTGQKKLNEGGVEVVQVHGSRPGEYVVVERLNARFTLEEFLIGQVPLGPQRRALVEDELLSWARTSARFELIGDFHPGQLLYTDRGWILNDFAWGHTPSAGPDGPTVFENGNFARLPARLAERLNAAIREGRRGEARERLINQAKAVESLPDLLALLRALDSHRLGSAEERSLLDLVTFAPARILIESHPREELIAAVTHRQLVLEAHGVTSFRELSALLDRLEILPNSESRKILAEVAHVPAQRLIQRVTDPRVLRFMTALNIAAQQADGYQGHLTTLSRLFDSFPLNVNHRRAILQAIDPAASERQVGLLLELVRTRRRAAYQQSLPRSSDTLASLMNPGVLASFVGAAGYAGTQVFMENGPHGGYFAGGALTVWTLLGVLPTLFRYTARLTEPRFGPQSPMESELSELMEYMRTRGAGCPHAFSIFSNAP